MKDDDLIDRLRRMDWPGPSLALRTRVVATPLRPARISWSDRLFYSRACRASLMAATIVLVAVNVSTSRAPEPAETPALQAERAALEDLATWAGLSQESAASLARRAHIVSPESVIDVDTLVGGAHP